MATSPSKPHALLILLLAGYLTLCHSNCKFVAEEIHVDDDNDRQGDVRARELPHRQREQQVPPDGAQRGLLALRGGLPRWALGAVYQREERRRPPHRPPRAFLGPFPQGTEGRWLTPSTLLPVAPALSTILVQSLWDRWSYTIYLSPLQKGDLVNSFSTLQQTNYHLILVYKIPYIISIFY